MRRILWLISIFVFTLSLTLLGACNCAGGNTSESSGAENSDSSGVNVVEEVQNVERYSVLDLTGNHVGEDVVWSSSNESVVLVSNGIVFGVAGGSAEITATAGETVTKYTVVVKATTSYMRLMLSQTEMELLVNGTKSLSFCLMDNNGGVIPDDFVSYELTAENDCAELDKNTVIAKKTGECFITVKATCAGKTIVEDMRVTIKDNASISFDKVTVDGIYTNSLGGTLATSKQLNVFVYENDQIIAAPSLNYTTSNDEVAEVSSVGVVTGKTGGTATITATYSTTAGKEISATVNVVVACPVVSASECLETEVFAETDTEIDVSAYAPYFNEEMSAVSVLDDLDNQISATIEAGTVTLDNSMLTYGDRILNITINEGITFSYEAKVVTKYISTAEQLANLAEAYGNRDTTGTYEGYYVLTNDIDMSGAVIDYNSGDENIASAVKDYCGFKGVFDGKGYTVYNANDNIFGKVSKDGVIKNVAFYSNKPLKYGAVACLFAGTLENVYVHSDLSAITAEHYSSIGYRTLGTARFKNVVVEVVGKSEVVTSTLIYDTVKFPPTVENVYVISPNANDPIVFKNGKVNGTVVHYAISDAEKDFSLLDKSSGYWMSGVNTYRFITSNLYDLPFLATPNKDTFVLENGTLTWAAVENANGYTLLVDDEEIVVATNCYTGFTGEVVRIKANGTENAYRDSLYSEPYIRFNIPDGYLADFSSESYTEIVSPLDRHLEPVVTYLPEGHTSVTEGALKIELTTTMVDNGAWAGFKLSLPKTAPNGSNLKVKLYIQCDYATGVYICDGNFNRFTADGTNKIDITSKGGWVEQMVDCSVCTGLEELIFRAYTSSPNRKVTIYLASVKVAE